jgi:PAS domain S-box-containing protein
MAQPVSFPQSPESIERLQFALQAAAIGTWDLDIANQQVWWDERCKELYGFKKDDIVSYDQVLSYMHPEDRETVDKAVQWALTTASDGHYDIRGRTIGATDGQLRWLHCQGKAYFDQQGIAYRFSGIAQDITTEKLLQQQLQQQQQRLTTILEQIPVGILIADEKGELIYANPQIERIFRHPLGDIPHQEAYQNGALFDPATNEPLPVEAIPMVRTLQKGETLLDVELKLRRGDGSWGYTTVNTVPIIDPHGKLEVGVAAFMDTTQRRQAEEALRQSEGRLRAVLESLTDGIYFGGVEGITLANQAALDQLGYGAVEDLNRNIGTLAQELQTRDWLSGAAIPIDEQAFARALSGQHIVQDVVVRHRLSGEDRVVRCAASPVVVDDQVVAAVAINTDVTELRRSEEALRQSEARYRQLSLELEARVQTRTHELELVNQDLQRSNDNLQQFAYVASHDLQEPLRKIQAFGTLLGQYLGEELDATASDYLERITKSSARMSTLIKDLLSYSRISTRQQRFDPISLDAVVAGVLETLSLEIEQCQAQIEVDELPIVNGDESQLSQLFQNLLSNALKFTPASEYPKVRVDYFLRQLADLPPEVRPKRSVLFYHQISVSDQGIGFDTKYLDRIFQVFQRLHGKNEYAGTGVGLAIVQRVVENHGGGITADSAPGKGATFCVYLPA